jgi:uncharacterized protein (DUF4415 family)
MHQTSAADNDSPEWTDADFASARPCPEMVPEFARKLRADGVRSSGPRSMSGVRLAADVVEGIKATGKGYNARVERVPREAPAGEL